ncbi:MAG: hypothetical protein IJC17_04760 [Clostridia bacterium]|nr:hypothetical protein [Clostridia bacterium]
MNRMEFVFNNEKARALGYTAVSCYDAVDRLFSRHGIYPTSQGVYEGPDDQNTFNAFGAAQRLPDDTDWFLKTIETWRSFEEGEWGDCLAVHYYYEKLNS